MKRKWISILVSVALVVGLAMLYTPKPALAATITSAQSGNWDSVSTWVGGVVPQAGDDVIIATGHMVAVNVNTASLAGITVNGTLRFDNSGTGKSMTVTGNVTVNSGGTLDVATGGSATTHSLTMGGNLSNSGTFDCRPAVGRIVNVVFNNTSADQTISGTSPTRTRFNKITLDKGSSSRKVTASIDVTISGGTDSITWTNGAWEQTVGTMNFTSGNQTLTANGNLTVNNSGSISFADSLIVTGGTFTIDTSGTTTIGGSDNRMEINSGTVALKSGTVNVGGRIGPASGGGVISSGTLRIQGATVNVPAAGLNNTTTGVFMIGTGATFEMSSGTLNIKQANQGSYTGNDIQIGVGTITGGEIVIGSDSPGTQEFLTRIDVSVYRLTINASGCTVQLQTSDLTVNENLTINAGTLDIGTNIISNVSGTMTNNGTLKQTKTVNQNATTSFLNVSGGKYYGVDITLGAVGDMGSTVVSIKGNQTCGTAGSLPNTVKRCYEITPATSRSATVKFYYRSDEANGNTSPNVYHWNSSTSTWDLQTFANRGGSEEGMYVEASGISSYSPFALKDNQPTAVTLSSLTVASPLPAALPVLGLVALGGLAAAAALGIGAGLVRRRRA